MSFDCTNSDEHSKDFMVQTNGLWVRKNLENDTLELWYNGQFHCYWDDSDEIEARLLSICRECVKIGILEGRRRVAVVLGAKEPTLKDNLNGIWLD